MSGTNGGGPDASNFDALADQIEGLHAVAAAKRDVLRAELTEAEAEVKRLERMLHIARPLPESETPRKTPRKSRPSNSSNRSRVSERTIDAIERFLIENDPSPERGFTRADIAKALGVSDSSVSYGLQDLRKAERVRLVGKANKQPGKMGQRKSLYAVMPNG